MRTILYANKRFLISIKRAEDDGILINQVADVPYTVGELIATDQLGNSFLISEKYFNENYLPVEKIHSPVAKQLSPFEEQFKKEALESNKPL